MKPNRPWIVLVPVLVLVLAGAGTAWWFLARGSGPDETTVAAPAVAPAPPAPVEAEQPPGMPPPLPETGEGPPVVLHKRTLANPGGPMVRPDGTPVPTPQPPVAVKAKGPPPIPDNPNAKDPHDEKYEEGAYAKYQDQYLCGPEQEAKLSERERVLARHVSPRLGKPTSVGSDVDFGGFAVVAVSRQLKLEQFDPIRDIRGLAVKQGLCSWASPLLELDSGAAARGTVLDGVVKMRILLPVADASDAAAPLEAGTIPRGVAYVGRPMKTEHMTSRDLAAFEADVTKSGATPKGPLLGRLDDHGTVDPSDDTVQLIQPVAAP